jgi:uncharacterized protein YPO0396
MAESGVQTLLLGDLPDPKLGQFRMRQLSVWNWGTFSKLHKVTIPENGTLLLGPSGAGKSTLLDAISAMIVPPVLLRLNAAADESTRGDRDRSLMSYVRGAWSSKGDSVSSELAKQYLRPDSTWSAIALEYGNGLGRQLTLVRLFWVTAAGTSANLNRHFMVVDGAFDLAQGLEGFAGDRRKLKLALDRPEIRHHDDNFAAYADHWCRVMGITDDSALELLHRTQSTKNLSDLNNFLREFMLAEPQTFAIAEQLVNEFVDLDQAHQAVVAAREQIETLAPARETYQAREGTLAAQQAAQSMLGHVPAFKEALRVGLLEAELVTLATARVRGEGESATATTELHGLGETIEGLERRRSSLGGDAIGAIEGKVRELEGERDRALKARERAQQACQKTGWTLATDPAGFAEQVAAAARLVRESQAEALHLSERDRALAVKKHELSQEFATVRAEVKALEASPSNIPAHMQDLRERLCAALGLQVSNVPFVGELLEVRAEEAAWAGAAERLLHSFALSMLISKDDQRRVARWVDETHLRGKLVYYAVDANLPSPAKAPGPQSILHKIARRQHPYAGWIHRELVDRFDYACVANAADLAKGDFRITQKGQIRGGRNRTEKDDRREVNDRRHWVLGFDSRAKLELFKQRAQDLGSELAVVDRDLAELERHRQQDGLKSQGAAALEAMSWRDIDAASVAKRIEDQLQTLEALRRDNPDLADMEGRLAAARERRDDLQRRLADLRAELRQIEAKAGAAEEQLTRAKVEAGALTASQRAALEARLGAAAGLSLDTVAERVHDVERGLHGELRALGELATRQENAITTALAEFARRWPAEAADLPVSLAAAPEFFAVLQRLEQDGLPGHETRFLELLRTQTGQRLAELSRHLNEARREIARRLDDVNSALETVPYNPDSYLQIRTVDLRLPETTEFRQRLSEAFASQQRGGDAAAEAEARFQILRKLVLDLRADTPELKRWRDTVLDVRKHVEFLAEERDRRTDREIETYSGGGGRSGGQRQKLTATCLAAALRYKLGGADGGPPTYAAVVLDEAFAKTDSEFTATCMRIFTELGFQMIVATPLKSVMTLEEFVGGATYVTIADRKRSSVLKIEYDAESARLKLGNDLQRTVEDPDEVA